MPARKKKLTRKRQWLDLKIDQPLNILLRRGSVDVKKRRAKYFAYEKKVFFMENQRCAVAVDFHIRCAN